MCKAWENSMNQARNEGINQGINQGISQGISQGIGQGIGQGKVEAVLNVAKKFSLSIEEAMDAVGIQKSEWDTYAPMVEKRLKANTL